MHRPKVLIVEDEENARTGLAELVSSWGYRTDTAKDGLDAIDKVTVWTPAIIVTDLKMPRMDGLELLQRLADFPEQMAVVVLTVVPILIVYPFVQRHFTKGVLLGAIKG
jgi:CheY-like chemotaxis protein